MNHGYSLCFRKAPTRHDAAAEVPRQRQVTTFAP